MNKIRVAIAGVGNCSSSLVQGLEYYRGRNEASFSGLMNAKIGDWGAERYRDRGRLRYRPP